MGGKQTGHGSTDTVTSELAWEVQTILDLAEEFGHECRRDQLPNKNIKTFPLGLHCGGQIMSSQCTGQYHLSLYTTKSEGKVA